VTGGSVLPASKNMSSSRSPKSGSSICEDICIAREVSPTLWPRSRSPRASFIDTHSCCTA
jgi:hypothetical protein